MFSRHYGIAHSHMLDLIEPFKFFDDPLKSVPRRRLDTIDEEGIKIEIPGVKQSDINVTINDRVLNVVGKSRRGDEFNYSYSLKQTVDDAAITAKLQDGLLTIALPKRSEHAPRKIEIT